MKELFPTELVPASSAPDEHDDGGEVDSPIFSVNEESPARRGAADGRKKRVFWGGERIPSW